MGFGQLIMISLDVRTQQLGRACVNPNR